MALYDDFNRSNNPNIGGLWSQDAGDQEILSNALSNSDGGDTRCVADSTSTVFTGPSQYVKGVWATSSDNGLLHVRVTNAASARYAFEINLIGSIVSWYVYNDAGTEGALVQDSASLSLPSAGNVGITCDGTGSSVTVRIWKGTTNNAPDSATSWDSRSADSTLTNDPGTLIDSGNFFGAGSHASAPHSFFWDSVYAGDIPAGGASATQELALLGVGF